MTIKAFIDKYFAGILFVAGLIGLLVPDPGESVSYIILAMLFLIIFTSFFQFELKKSTLRQNLLFSLLIGLLRFVAIPVAVFYALQGLSHFWAFALAFLFLLPSGVSSPAIVSLFKGNFQLAVTIMILANLIALMTIPLFVPDWFGLHAKISPNQLVYTLLITILLPFLLHLPLRKKEKVVKITRNNLPFVTVICLSTINVLGVAKNKEYLLNDPMQVLYFFLINLGIYSALFSLGWLLLPGRGNREKVAAGMESGMNNIGLGVALSIIYFTPQHTIYFISAQFSWLFILIPLKYFIRKYFIN